MPFLLKLAAILTLFLISPALSEISNEKVKSECSWNKKNLPCLTIKKPIPNTSKISEIGVKRYLITSKDPEIKHIFGTRTNSL